MPKNKLIKGIPALGLLSQLRGRVSSRKYHNIRTSQAIKILLDLARWPRSKRRIAQGKVTLDWWWVDNCDAFDALRQLVEAEGPDARLFEDEQGMIRFDHG